MIQEQAESASCKLCGESAATRVVVPRFQGEDYGHVRCVACGATFDSNVEEIRSIPLDRSTVNGIVDPTTFRRLFVETWEIADSETGDVYPDFNWTDNDSVKKGVAMHVIAAIESEFPDRKDPAILDLGCGNGFTTVELARHFPDASVLGVDPSPNVIGLRANFGVDTEQGTLETLELPDESRDVIIILGNFMLHRDLDFTLSEAYRILRPGGLLVVDFKNINSAPRRVAALLARLPFSGLQSSSAFQRNFVNMRYGLGRKHMDLLLARNHFEKISDYSKPPRLLEFENSSAQTSGAKGAVWKVFDMIDGLTDNRAWIQVSARRPTDCRKK